MTGCENTTVASMQRLHCCNEGEEVLGCALCAARHGQLRLRRVLRGRSVTHSCVPGTLHHEIQNAVSPKSRHKLFLALPHLHITHKTRQTHPEHRHQDVLNNSPKRPRAFNYSQNYFLTFPQVPHTQPHSTTFSSPRTEFFTLLGKRPFSRQHGFPTVTMASLQYPQQPAGTIATSTIQPVVQPGLCSVRHSEPTATAAT